MFEDVSSVLLSKAWLLCLMDPMLNFPWELTGTDGNKRGIYPTEDWSLTGNLNIDGELYYRIILTKTTRLNASTLE